MKRITAQTQGQYMAQSTADAVQKLGKFEDLCETLAAEKKQTEQTLEALRTAGKTKTVQCREALAQKLSVDYVLTLLQVHGLLAEED